MAIREDSLEQLEDYDLEVSHSHQVIKSPDTTTLEKSPKDKVKTDQVQDERQRMIEEQKIFKQ